MSNYYLNRDGEVSGPHTVEDIQQRIARREVGKMDLICPEGGTEWVPASILANHVTPAATMLGHYHVSPMTTGAQRTTEKHVKEAYQKLKAPGLGILFSIALPLILWAAKSDAERGVGISGSRQGLQSLARENTDLLPLAIGIGIIGVVGFSIWFRKTLKWARLVKASYEYKQR